MGDIQNFFGIDFKTFISTCFVIMAGAISMYVIIGKFSEMIGKPVKWVRQRKEDHELLVKTVQNLDLLQKKEVEDTKQSIKHDEAIRKDILNVSETMLQIKKEVTLMRTQRDNDKLAEYKDKVGQSYRYYKERKFSEENPVPYWNHMEKEALEGLIRQYESHGGSNSFVHSIVEPEIQTWKLVD